MPRPSAVLLALAAVAAAPAVTGCLQDLPDQGSPYGGGNPGEAPPGLEGFVSTEPFPTEPAAGNVTVEQVDVGQGDGLVVHFPDAVAVVDTGPWYDPGETAVLDHLRAEGVTWIRALVVTHPDADHSGGCDEVLEGFDIRYIIHPGSGSDTETWSQCRAAMEAEAATVLTDAELDPGHHLNLSAHASTRLLALDAHTEDVNAGSVVLRLDYGGFEADLTGDTTCPREQAMLERGFGRDVDMLKVAHHGSSSSTCQAWLDATTPEVATIGVGADNPYGHPHDEVLDRLRDHAVAVYRTDLHGTVDVTSDGSGWDVRTAEAPAGDGAGEPTNATGVEISEVQYDAPGNDNENLTEEWVEVANRGNATVDLAGWTLGDEAGHTYAFPDGNASELAANATVRVHTGSGDDGSGHLYWGRNGAVWNNGGDTATLRDAAGAVVDERSW